VLSAGGTAADAAAAAGFMLSVTLPSRAGLGGGGACVVYHPRRDAPEALIFMPGARQGGTETADRPAAVPMMARGLFALTTRMQGARPFEELIAPAEQMARFGAPASRALVADLAVVGGALLADPNARAVFTRPDGTALRLTSAEFDTLAALAAKPGEVRSREELTRQVFRRSWRPGGGQCRAASAAKTGRGVLGWLHRDRAPDWLCLHRLPAALTLPTASPPRRARPRCAPLGAGGAGSV
jgi:gamma-glutamyltranspeptidase/glutathione hydrolase